MKILLVASLAVFAFTGCVDKTSVAPGTAPAAFPLGGVVQAFGPPVAQIINTRLTLSMLEKNPNRENTLHLVAADLRIAVQAVGLNEISETLIKNFAHAEAVKYGLLPDEESLVAQALLAARAQFLASTGGSVVLITDPRVGAWIDAITNGIDGGIAEFHRRAALAK